MANDLNDLREIVDRLGPNMWLTLDEVSFPWFFKHGIEKGRDVGPALDTAREFARQTGATFIFDEHSRIAKFGRAYFKNS